MPLIRKNNRVDTVDLPDGPVEIILERRSVTVDGVVYYSLHNDERPLMVDSCDKHFLYDFTWRRLKGKNGVSYAQSQNKERPRKLFYLHRLILGAQPGQLVDHWNGNGLDCRRLNLRIASYISNARNKVSIGACGYRGVKITKVGIARYYAAICVDRKQLHSGSMFLTAEEAAAAYDEMARKYYKEDALLNFPMVGERGIDRTLVEATNDR